LNTKITRRSFIIGGGLTMFSYLFFEVHSVVVKRYKITIKNLPSAFNGFTILHLTDLHSKEYGNNQQDIIGLINRENYDAVAVTGDLVDAGKPTTDPAIKLLSRLKKKPIYFVPGNHDWWSNLIIIKPLLDMGVRVLQNTHEKLTIDGQHVWIVGVDDPYLEKDMIETALKGIGDAAPKLLLAHAPNIYPSAIGEKIDLVMVGHTHGGQVRLPLVGGLIVPGQGLFPKWDYGLYNSESTSMIINGGLGESVLPLRFYNRPEIVLITLVSLG
jgi:predicted MPP superfamily phosphohydrolase